MNSCPLAQSSILFASKMSDYPDYSDSLKYSVEIPKPDLTGFRMVLKVGTKKGTIFAYYNSSSEQVVLNLNEDKWFLQSDESIYESLKKVLCDSTEYLRIKEEQIWLVSKDGTKHKLDDSRSIDKLDSACWFWYDRYITGSDMYCEVYYEIHDTYEHIYRSHKYEHISPFGTSTEYQPEYSIKILTPAVELPKIAEVQTSKGQLNVYMQKQIYLELNGQWYAQPDNYTAESIASVLEVSVASLQSDTKSFLGTYWSKLTDVPIKVTITV